MDDYLDFVFTKPISSLLLGLLLFLAGLFLLGVPGSIVSTDWKATEGVVISSEIKESEGGAYDQGGWYPQISYRYTVNQIEYTSNKVHIADLGSSNTDDFARETTRKYPVGKKVMVSFDPDNPARSILERGPANEAILPALMLMIMGVLPVLVRLVLFRLTRRSHGQGKGNVSVNEWQESK